MPKIPTPSFVEGDIINKNDILDLKSGLKDINQDIDSENIREEGLDRRIFKPGSIVPQFENNQRVYSSATQGIVMNTKWKLVRYDDADDLKGNKASSNVPEIHIDWNPERDTHCIIRFSAYVDSRHSEARILQTNNFWDIGLVIVPPGVSKPDAAFLKTIHQPTSGLGDVHIGVYPYQRIGLTYAFSGGYNQGYLTRGESDDYVSDDPILHNQEYRVLSDDDGDTIDQLYRYQENTYPRGAWNQYAFDRAGNMNGSIGLVAHATSQLSTYTNDASEPDKTESGGQLFWTKKGTAKIYAVYRSALAAPSSSSTFTTAPYINIHSLSLQAQIIRR
jgi:hypothetical protein